MSAETTTQQATTDGIVLTEAAVLKVRALLDAEGRDDLSLRVAVQPGGCSGLRYQLFFDDRSLDGDVAKDYSGVAVVTDRMSAPYLSGATIDFVDTIEKQGFTIGNPNLEPTETDTWLIGSEYSPSFLKGFTCGLDYYRINQEGIPFASAKSLPGGAVVGRFGGSADNVKWVKCWNLVNRKEPVPNDLLCGPRYR